MPNFYKNGSDFSFSKAYPYPGYSAGGPIVEYNGFLFGKNTGNTSADPKQIWKTDGTAIGTQMISNNLDLWSAKVFNGNLYALGFSTTEGSNYYYQKIYKNNTITNKFDVAWGFPDGGFGQFSSHIFAHDNTIFVTTKDGGANNMNGLYKIDLSGTLPIKLNALTALYNNNKVQLNWQTLSETNNQGFDVERSINGFDFTKIGFVKGYGTTNEAQNYALTDENTIAQNQTIYYRLKQTDINGSFEYSKIVSVKIPQLNNATFTFYPNPVNGGKFTINLLALPKANYQINITNMAGLTVYKTNLVYDGGTFSETIAADLPVGVYVLDISSTLYRKTQKLIVQ